MARIAMYSKRSTVCNFTIRRSRIRVFQCWLYTIRSYTYVVGCQVIRKSSLMRGKIRRREMMCERANKAGGWVIFFCGTAQSPKSLNAHHCDKQKATCRHPRILHQKMVVYVACLRSNYAAHQNLTKLQKILGETDSSCIGAWL